MKKGNMGASYGKGERHLNGDAGAAAGTKKPWWNVTSQTDFIIMPAVSQCGSCGFVYIFFYFMHTYVW